MKVRITPARGYAHGHIETLLIQLGITPPSPRHPEGLVIMDLSDAQIAAFQLKGNAHRVERLPDDAVDAPIPVAPSAPAPTPVAASSALVALECPECKTPFQLVRAMLPDGTTDVECIGCHATIKVENFVVVGCLKKDDGKPDDKQDPKESKGGKKAN